MKTGHVREQIHIEGFVQGVGFRPFVYRLAKDLALSGFVRNLGHAVDIEVEGTCFRVEEFVARVQAQAPQGAQIRALRRKKIQPCSQNDFHVRASLEHSPNGLTIAPDRTLCADCARDVLDPENRRHLYPFTTCTICGPRYTLVKKAPFDRANTTMRSFSMCSKCLSEYESPGDRRFHSQTNACPECGPQMELFDSAGQLLSRGRESLPLVIESLGMGKIVALKSVGGFQLLVDAKNEAAIQRLRERKMRPAKPLAVMMKTLAEASQYVDISNPERLSLLSPEAPIVLLQRHKNGFNLAESVAPGLSVYGVMLPSSALHYILLHEFQGPLVVTSGNLSDEPLCYDNAEALHRLNAVADFFWLHDREIARPLDDSVVREIDGDVMVLRRARGFCPSALETTSALNGKNILALGAQSKNSLALEQGGRVYVGPHLGSLDSALAVRALENQVTDWPRFYGAKVEAMVCDRHRDYASTAVAERSGLPLERVQHHLAHVLSAVADRQVPLPVLGVAWDGSGDGGDGTIWGGEFLHVDTKRQAQRMASIFPFRLPGGETCVREPRRSALGCWHALLGESLSARAPQELRRMFHPQDFENLSQLLNRKNARLAPICTSVGRLFDAAAALIGLSPVAQYEGQAAMQMESLALCHGQTEKPYSLSLVFGEGRHLLDFRPLLEELLFDLRAARSRSYMAVRFHLALATATGDLAEKIGEPRVVLSGGVFQNRFLSEATAQELRKRGLTPFLHRKIPPNDGGLAVGQLMMFKGESCA